MSTGIHDITRTEQLSLRPVIIITRSRYNFLYSCNAINVGDGLCKSPLSCKKVLTATLR